MPFVKLYWCFSVVIGSMSIQYLYALILKKVIFSWSMFTFTQHCMCTCLNWINEYNADRSNPSVYLDGTWNSMQRQCIDPTVLAYWKLQLHTWFVELTSCINRLFMSSGAVSSFSDGCVPLTIALVVYHFNMTSLSLVKALSGHWNMSAEGVNSLLFCRCAWHFHNHCAIF